MTRRPTLFLLAAALLAAPLAGAAAQVGYPPEASPFRDLEYRHEVTVLGGWYKAQKDRAGIAPQSGPLVGARYALHASGPVYLIAELSTVFSNRDVIDPSKPPASRKVTEESTQLYMADVSLAFALTGHRSWHHLTPELSLGGGVVASGRRGVDVGGYEFGAPLALSLGTGVRWVPGDGKRWLVRGDMKSRMYKVTYPSTYFQPASGGSAVLKAGSDRSGWTFNPAFTLGVSLLLGR